MGLIRKAASVSTLGAVKYTSRKEAQTKAALAEARLAKEQAKAVKAQAAAAKATDKDGVPPDAPWYRQPTVAAALRAHRSRQQDVS